MKRYVVKYADGSQMDLAGIAAFIMEQSSEERAMRYVRRLVNECSSLHVAPYRGNKRDDLRPNMRLIGYKREVAIVFRIEEQSSAVVILGFAYRGRSLDEISNRNE
jgi:plasmid stabilization system protein ParE